MDWYKLAFCILLAGLFAASVYLEYRNKKKMQKALQLINEVSESYSSRLETLDEIIKDYTEAYQKMKKLEKESTLQQQTGTFLQ
ncbi:hypothetical protein RJD11_12155 [Bacillus velezensis]|uniref:hypothetical protein n=1 Tax=Bacillus TaxID=1386 RepID=UPI001C528B7C|nr:MULTISPECIES: hypothetical protein [Bacillus amyloliquefaciens group]MBV2197441.1 hypothetical protein [Bacillus velezensis]QXP99313.1 hypothetical protein KVY05_21350 [Bacillus velezensis]UHH01345.1 hypothetical protein LUA14_12080 [Bacillus amyloliquefaciens]ULR21093.1 hypothetical protein MJE83_12080 [Bacillus velezensis]UVW07836.1 hypothetical protein NX856_12120 [Bacillus velezensis]